MAERRPSATQIENAGRILAREADDRGKRIREEQGHSGHVAAQEWEHKAMMIESVASSLANQRRAERR